MGREQSGTVVALTDAEPREPSPWRLEGLTPGQVTAVAGSSFSVLTESGRLLRARRAAACLLDPEPGDLVLLYPGGAAKTYILSVLEKRRTDSTLSFPGDVRLAADAGTIRLAGHDVGLNAEGTLKAEAGEMVLQGVRGEAVFAEASFVAARFKGAIHAAEIVYGTLRSAARLMIMALRDSIRRVDGVDSVEAGRMRTRVAGSYGLKAGRATLRAEQDVCIDGEKIHLG